MSFPEEMLVIAQGVIGSHHVSAHLPGEHPHLHRGPECPLNLLLEARLPAYPQSVLTEPWHVPYAGYLRISNLSSVGGLGTAFFSLKNMAC